MNTSKERRKKQRTPRGNWTAVRLRFQQGPGLEQAITVRLMDIHERGCSLEAQHELAVTLAVTLSGDLCHASGSKIEAHGHISWCERASDRTWRAGIQFAELIQLDEHPGEKTAGTQQIGALENVDDYYELLQLSPNADSETIQRVYRILAARYHPDNQETGHADTFRRLSEAHATLADGQRRAAYDVDHQLRKRLRWKIFDQPAAAQGKRAERAKRNGILSLLYTKRVASPEHPDMSIVELGDLLGVPREHLDFSLWFLKESGFIIRTDSGKLSITLKGVVEAENAEVARETERHGTRLLGAVPLSGHQSAA